VSLLDESGSRTFLDLHGTDTVSAREGAVAVRELPPGALIALRPKPIRHSDVSLAISGEEERVVNAACDAHRPRYLQCST
jgi:hypothetical protein